MCSRLMSEKLNLKVSFLKTQPQFSLSSEPQTFVMSYMEDSGVSLGSDPQIYMVTTAFHLHSNLSTGGLDVFIFVTGVKSLRAHVAVWSMAANLELSRSAVMCGMKTAALTRTLVPWFFLVKTSFLTLWSRWRVRVLMKTSTGDFVRSSSNLWHFFLMLYLDVSARTAVFEGLAVCVCQVNKPKPSQKKGWMFIISNPKTRNS